MRLDRYSLDKWPEYYVELERTVELRCPRCNAVHECDVDVNKYGASARIDTDYCEACSRLLCSECPCYTVDGLKFCTDCKDAAEDCSKESGEPIVEAA